MKDRMTPCHEERLRRTAGLRAACILLVLAPLLFSALPAAAQPPDLQAAYRFLLSERDAGGILYTATSGKLAGRQLPLSYHDSAAYWGEHVCAMADCTVVDVYNPHTYTLLPEPSSAGDLQTERINTHNGASIYDAATWQIAVMLGRTVNRLDLAPGQDPYGLVSNQNLLLTEAHSGDSPYPVFGASRAVTVGPVFVYNGQRITEPARAFSFRMLPRTWLSRDPLAASPYARLIKTAGLPAPNPEYQAGTVNWTDWKPITGENAWAFLLGPLQAADLHYRVERKAAFVPLHDPALSNALALLPTFAALQSSLGAVYHAPAGTVANQGGQLIDPHFVAVENNISLYAGLRLLRATLETTLRQDNTLLPADRERIDIALRLSGAMIDGGEIGGGGVSRTTLGLLHFFRHHAWQDGAFVQGGYADDPATKERWRPAREAEAVDVTTWGIAALGAERIDGWFGFGSAYRAWQQVKGWGGYGEGTTLWGVGFSDRDGNGLDAAGRFRQGVLSVEWTAGAITMVRSLIDHYRTLSPASPGTQQARAFLDTLHADEQSMLAAMERLRVDTYADTPFPGQPQRYRSLFPLATRPYLYASRRHSIPFGWYANPIPSTCATAWMVMVANHYNPFVPGGDPR